MERCDFSSVITIIRNYISESREINQTDLLYNLFDAFTKEEENKDYVFDNGLVCRWIKGIANISPQIIMYYTDDNNQKCLSADIENNILPLMYDSDMAVQEIYNLVVFDTTISDAKKSELTKHHPFSNSKEKADGQPILRRKQISNNTKGDNPNGLRSHLCRRTGSTSA